MLHALEIGIQLLQAIAVAHEHEHLIEQMLKRRLIEQQLNVGALVVRRHQQSGIGVRAQRIGSMSCDRDDFALPIAKLTTKLIERGVLSLFGERHQHVTAIGDRDARGHQHSVCVTNC